MPISSSLRRGKAQGDVNPNSFFSERGTCFDPVARQRELHHDVFMQLREAAALGDHLIGNSSNDFRTDVAVDDFADQTDLLFDRTAFFCNKGRVSGDAVDNTPVGAFFDLFEIGRVQKNFHVSLA
jgi:hypothetical protein